MFGTVNILDFRTKTCRFIAKLVSVTEYPNVKIHQKMNPWFLKKTFLGYKKKFERSPSISI